MGAAKYSRAVAARERRRRNRLLVGSKCPYGIERLINDQLEHEPQLDRARCSQRMHGNKLYGISEWLRYCVDRIDEFFRNRAAAIDHLQLYNRGKRFSRNVRPKWSGQRDNFQRDIGIRLRTSLGSQRHLRYRRNVSKCKRREL